MNRAIGICTGASTISLVTLDTNGSRPAIRQVITRPHEGNPREVLNELLESLALDESDPIAVTGRRFKESLNLTPVSEPLAVEHALRFVNRQGTRFNAVISAGGETFLAYRLDGEGRISRVYSGNKCASGTGEFFIQQTRRMDVSLENAVDIARSEEPYTVSGRCSVFCKSDCTHATNKGIPKGRVVAGLGRMMAAKVLELLKNTPRENIMMVGGTTRIGVMVDYLREEISNLVIPKEAAYFEALGAALWASENATLPLASTDGLYGPRQSQFEYHRPLRGFEDQVTFSSSERGIAQPGDVCILGLDVGSTTTKAVLLRESDLKVVAGNYRRTNGDPVAASRACYRSLLGQLNGTGIVVRGLGATGSGRQIAGLHALTDGVINEIIAHATAACHIDPEVDTIFEIGGQDAKYTYITNGVASDYAMNEACSAGTGSFLEESARETLGIRMEDIADRALEGDRPPNFSDQCAAFISSDIKNAFHEGIRKEDVAAGLVYSICMNYVNRVKGARPVGEKVFMQGGVCYNRAVPLAMAALSGKQIIVPPDPGMTGAFGVALEVKNRIDQGLMTEGRFDLQRLADREVEYKSSFKCTGGRERCDIGCTVNRIVIEGKTYPFGGACNLYYNIRHSLKVDAGRHDLVVRRQQVVFEEYAPDAASLGPEAPTVGIPQSFLVNTYYPLFSHFFAELDLRPVLSDEVDPDGLDRIAAPFCYPCELSHGYLANLLKKDTDFLFLPHIPAEEVDGVEDPVSTCPLLQGESYYLRSAFEDLLRDRAVLAPVIDLSADRATQRAQFQQMAEALKRDPEELGRAYDRAREVQDRMRRHMLELGREALREIERDPERTGVVLMGRPYNAYAGDANKGIPHRFASRGITIIPVDFLELGPYPARDHMYWAMGHVNLKGARFIEQHPQLFGCFITNFSCGPDSFVIGYFRDILGSKPSLTLELDNHTADAGLETRIEAFLDIVNRYRSLQSGAAEPEQTSKPFRPATAQIVGGRSRIVTSDGETVTLFDPRVRLVFPSMNPYSAQAAAATYRGMGIRAQALPPMNEEHLSLGRGHSSCKECLPLLLTMGALIKYLRDDRPEDEITVYFMPTTDGPCRQGQYRDFLNDHIRKKQFRNTAVLSVTSGDGYGGLGSRIRLLNWNAVVAADVFEDIHNAMLVLTEDPRASHRRLQEVWAGVVVGLEGGRKTFRRALRKAAIELRSVPQTSPLQGAPQVLVVGEVFVRKEGIARRWLPERLADSGIVSHVAPIHEWVYYVDWLVENGLLAGDQSPRARLVRRIQHAVMLRAERWIKRTMAQSGWYVPRLVDIEGTIAAARDLISPSLRGEAVLTVGGPMAGVGREFCGAIAIGPFGCMPNRLGESILNLKMDREHVLRFRKDEMTERVTREVANLPFLAVESDGNPFPQLIDA
ncbi:MAG: acyl-CoA dehydratase activase, partial [bacterium]